jgi:hypothetical protein
VVDAGHSGAMLNAFIAHPAGDGAPHRLEPLNRAPSRGRTSPAPQVVAACQPPVASAFRRKAEAPIP